MRVRLQHSVMVLVLIAAAWPLLAEEDWSTYDWSQERKELGRPGETTQDALEQMQRAMAASNMQISMSAVGFDIPAGSTAENYLQKAAQVGGGSYYRAEAGGQLTQIMDDAASGRPPQPTVPQPVTGQLLVGRSLQDGRLQGAADHFPSAVEVWVHATFTDMPQNSLAECVWRRDGQEVNRSQRNIGGTGWVAFSINTTAPGGLQAGAWSVSITAAGRSLGTKQFSIGQPAAVAPALPAAPATVAQPGESLVFCRSVENGVPIGVATSFRDITQLLGCFSFRQRPAGDVVAVWYINGQETARTRQSIQAGDGAVWFGYRRQDGGRLRPGTYRLELRIGGRTVAAHEATVAASDAAG